MKVLLDTNVIVDVALERQPFFADSRQVLLLVEQEQVEGYISASTFSDIYYLVRRGRGREWAKEFVIWLVTFCRIATVDRVAVLMALNANFKDFEDAIQHSTAVLNQLEAIVTRDTADFPVSTPRIITPAQLIQELTNSP